MSITMKQGTMMLWATQILDVARCSMLIGCLGRVTCYNKIYTPLYKLHVWKSKIICNAIKFRGREHVDAHMTAFFINFHL